MTQPSEHLLAAVVDLLVAEGFEGISIRRVASVAGVSIGAVQHHFPTKDALLSAAMQREGDRFEARVTQRLGQDPAPAAALRALADELLGTGEERRPASVVWLLRLARAAVHEPTAAVHRADWQRMEDLLHRLLAAARPDLGEDRAREEAAALLALLDGLAEAVVVEPERMPEQRARALVERHLAALLEP